MSNLLYKGRKFELTFQEFFPFFMNYPWATKGFFDGFKKLSGFTYEAIAYFPNGLQLEKYIDIDDVKKKTKDFMEQKREATDFFTQQGDDYKKLIQELEADVWRLTREDFSSYTNEDLSKALIDLHHKIEPYFAYSNWYYLLSLEIESLIREDNTGATSTDIQETMLALATSYLPNATARFSSALNKSAIKYNKSSESERTDVLDKEAKKLAEDFFWLTTFSNIPRAPETFTSDIKNAALKLDDHVENHQIKLAVPKGWVAAMKVATYVKDDVSTYFIPYFWLSLRELWEAIRSRVGFKSHEELWYFSYYDIANYLTSGQLISEEEIEKRKAGITTEEGDHEVVIKVSKDAQDFFNSVIQKHEEIEVKEIKGNAAYPGLVRATVRIIREKNQFSTFNVGEILVAPYTAPEYVPLMQKAAAIITDTGGITSHAAIVSRELKIPCIVGTKIATKVLKDGDMVEVDANKGLITILK